MSGGGTDDAEMETLRIARDEARVALERQLSTLDDIDSKALSVFRLNVALVGLLLSALSFAGASDMATVTALVNPVVGVGVASFVLSATAAGLTYTISGYQVGVGPDALENTADLSEQAFLQWLLVSYGDWLRYNEQTNVRKALLVTLSVLGTVGGALALAVGTVSALTGRFLGPAVVALAVLVTAAGVAGLPSQLRRLLGESGVDAEGISLQSFEMPMAGQRTFTGRDRRK
ncbi:hypothetical protein ELS19_10105 [Halogeometricum borinquense]|uniref:Uncharacterized protein n=2 Tax=Halogeometricum borinquense TaxID=60847 RepID=A0A482T981_9EURY|nr:hypothetical protein ELS19_10105 [Halogeometricum borinquense]